MCLPALFAGLGAGAAGAAGAATAAGSVAGAATAGSLLSTLGTVVGIGGSLLQGIQGARAAEANVAAIAAQKATEAQLNATEELRTRKKFMSAIAQQRAELAAKGVTLDSVTAVALGQTAAQEMSFESQRIRSEGAARQVELSNEQRQMRANRLSSILKGSFQAADTLLTAAPDLWPGFGRGRGAA